MKFFKYLEFKEAKAFVASGGQALHENPGANLYPGAPKCFKQSKRSAHLLDADKERLEKTVRNLGVRVVFIHHEGTDFQHVDLCGKPLDRALREAGVSI